MPDPANYASAFAGLPSPTEAFTQGLQGGVDLNNAMIKQQQQQAALAQQQQQHDVVRALIANPNAGADEYAAATNLVPGMREQFKQAWDMKNQAQKESHLSNLSLWGAAIQNGKPEIAVDSMNAWADAMENKAKGPTRDSQVLRAQAEAVKEHPEFGRFLIKSMLVAHPDGGKVVDAISKLGVEERAANEAAASLRTKNANAGAAEADAAGKSAEVLGQTLGALANAKNVKPTQVAAAMKSLAAKGVIPKDQLDAYLNTIPESTAELPEYLNVYRMSGMAPKDQAKYTTPDANNVLDNQTSRANTAANNAVTMRGQNMVDARAQKTDDPEGVIPPETVTMMAEQYRAGDTSVMQNLGRGAQGAKNIIAIRNEIGRQTREAGGNGKDLAAQNAEYFGTKAGQRTAGTRIANVEMASNEAESLIPLARTASAAVARSGLLPFGKVQVMFDNQTNDPALRKFAAANNALVNVYSRAISPSGVPTVADKEHAREMIGTAMDHKSYMAVLDQMQMEITAARAAPQAVRKAFNSAVTGKGGHDAQPTAAPAVGTIAQGYRFKGGDPSQPQNWVKQ